MAKISIFVLVAVGIALVSIVATPSESARIKRSPLDLNSIIAALNLIPFLQGATAQLNTQIQSLITLLQSQDAALQQAIQAALANLQATSGNLAATLQQFLTNLQAQLAANTSGIEASVVQTLQTLITSLQSFLAINATQLQTLINFLGGNISDAVAALQTRLAPLITFIQNGLASVANLPSVHTLLNALNSGALNQALTNIIVTLNGQPTNLLNLLQNLQTTVSATSTTLSTLLGNLLGNIFVLVALAAQTLVTIAI